MPILADAPPVVPTNLAPLPHLLAYAQSLGLERHLSLFISMNSDTSLGTSSPPPPGRGVWYTPPLTIDPRCRPRRTGSAIAAGVVPLRATLSPTRSAGSSSQPRSLCAQRQHVHLVRVAMAWGGRQAQSPYGGRPQARCPPVWQLLTKPTRLEVVGQAPTPRLGNDRPGYQCLAVHMILATLLHKRNQPLAVRLV